MPTNRRSRQTRTRNSSQQALARRQAGLRRVIEAISTELELRPLLTSIIRHACELLDADIGLIGLTDATRERIRVEATYQMPDDEMGVEFAPGVGLLGHVLLTHEPILLARYGDIAHPTRNDLSEYSALGVPIFWREKMIGVFSLGALPPRQFVAPDAELLGELAKHAAIAITNAQLFENEKRRTMRYAALNSIARLITNTLSLEQILQTAVDSFNRELAYPSVELLLTDPLNHEQLVLQALSGKYANTILPHYVQSIHEGIIGSAARERARIWIRDVTRDPRYIPIPGGERICSEVAVPLCVGDKLLGVLNIESDSPISEEDANDLDILADQLAIAIENARRYGEERERTERLALIARVSQRLNARLSTDELFATTVEELHERLGYDHVSLFIIQDHAPTILAQRARASRWPRGEAPNYRQPITEGILGLAARQRTPILINDVHHDPNYIPVPNATDLQAELTLPIVLGERLFGVLDLASTKRFRDEDVTALQIIADQLAVAIERTELFEATRGALYETKLLYDISRRISEAADVDEVVTAYLDQVAAHGAYVCNIVVYETDESNERKNFIVLGRWSPAEGLVRPRERVPYVRDALNPILDAGQSITFANIYDDPRAPEGLRELQKASGRPALALIPLMVRGQRIGLVVLSSPFVHEWNETDLQPYQASAAQLANAIDNRRQQLLLRERQQQVAVLEERQRLARELHDSVTQIIFSITLIAQSIPPALERDAAEGAKRIRRVIELSQSALVEMRALLAELRPPENVTHAQAIPDLIRVRQIGLARALKQYVKDVEHGSLEIHLDAEGYSRQSLTTEEALFRITQEALNNVVKHARAQLVKIRLTEDNGRIVLTVQDDGIGAGEGERRGGLGMKTMRERAEGIGGTFELVSEPAQGTTVRVTVHSSQ